MSIDEDLVDPSCAYERSNQCVVTATIKRFCSSSERCALQLFTDYESDEEFEKYFTPAFYANGGCKENEGYVSILVLLSKKCFDYLVYKLQMEFNCTVSIIDAAGYKRFLHTFVHIIENHFANAFYGNYPPKFGFDRYLERETLCNESLELLLGDCLNVHVEVNYRLRFMADTSIVFSTSVNNIDEGKFFIRLYSEFGRKLCEVSEYFQLASVTPMIENKTRCIFFPRTEYCTLLSITYILMKAKRIEIGSVGEICQLYGFADKYLIKTVIETSRQLLKSFFCGINDSKIRGHVVESILEISELAKRYQDESIEKMLAVFFENLKKFETNESDFENHLKYKLETDWTCKYVESLHCFHFHLPEKGGNDSDPELDFYS